MTYRSLLVLLDQDPLGPVRIASAVKLAKTLDCHLVGVAPTSLVDLPASPEAAASLGELAARVWETLRAQAQEATERFDAACRRAGLASFESVVDEEDKATSLVRHAHCSDLTVLTQADPASPTFRASREVVEQVVLHSARPTLILPYAGTFNEIGRRALVAWDDSREAARALADALPMLRHAESVQVVTWNASEPGGLAQTRLDALQRWLMWQGVIAEVQTDTSPVGIADTILSRAADLDADLLVMGAYGHARWAERALGGATRGLLESMTVPVLMSH